MPAEYTSPTRIKYIGPEVVAWRKGHGIFIEGSQFSNAYKKKWTDGMYYPGYKLVPNPTRLFLGAGLAQRLNQELNAGLVRIPPRLPVFDSSTPWETLRDYQREVLALIAMRHWGRVALATNAGKGAVIALFANAAANGGLRTLILCDEIAVFDALRDEVRLWGKIEPALIQAGYGDTPPEVPVTIAMQPSLYRKVKGAEQKAWAEWLQSMDVLLVDEADRSLGDSWKKIFGWCENTHWRIGFSGTFAEPDTIAALKQEELYGPILHYVGNEELIDRKISAKPHVLFHQIEHELPRRPATWYATRNEAGHMAGGAKRAWVYENTVWSSAARMALIRSLLDQEAINVVIVRSLVHGPAVAEALGAPFLSGSSRAKERTATLDALAAGDVRVLVTTSILDRGTNKLGMATNLIFASGEGSNTQTLQRVGRGLRRTGGKDYICVHDIMDTGHPYLDRQTRQRIKLYAAQNFETEIVA